MAITSVVTNSLANICQYLWANNNALRKGMFNGTINDKMPSILYMEKKALEYGIQQSLSTVQEVTNYVYSLLGSQLQIANNILTNGGGGVNVSSVANSSGSLQPYPVNVIVSAGQAGVSTLTSTAWVGLSYINTVVINGVVYQQGIGFTFNQATGTFDFSLSGYVLQEGDDVSALGFTPISSSAASAITPATAYANATEGSTTINIPITIGKTVSLAFRGTGLCEVITVGVPLTNQILFDVVTGNFIVAVDNPFFQNELIAVNYF